MDTSKERKKERKLKRRKERGKRGEGEMHQDTGRKEGRKDNGSVWWWREQVEDSRERVKIMTSTPRSLPLSLLIIFSFIPSFLLDTLYL